MSPHPCHTNSMPYLAWHDRAERLTRKGTHQQLCAVCDRWKFPGERCQEFEARQGGSSDISKNSEGETPNNLHRRSSTSKPIVNRLILLCHVAGWAQRLNVIQMVTPPCEKCYYMVRGKRITITKLLAFQANVVELFAEIYPLINGKPARNTKLFGATIAAIHLIDADEDFWTVYNEYLQSRQWHTIR